MKMKKGLLTMLALLSMGSSAFAQEEVQVGTVNVPTVTRKNESKTGAQVIILEKEKKGVILVKLENSNNKNRDLQFDLTLPKGINLENGETGGTSAISSTHAMGFGPTTSRFVLYSEDANYLPNETLIKIPVKVDESVTDVKTLEGKEGVLSNILTSDDKATKSNLISEATAFPFRVMLLGDVDDSGEVDLTDASKIVYKYFGAPPSLFVDEVAYVNNDDFIDLTDASSVVYLYFGSSSTAKQAFEEEEYNELDPE